MHNTINLSQPRKGFSPANVRQNFVEGTKSHTDKLLKVPKRFKDSNNLLSKAC